MKTAVVIPAYNGEKYFQENVKAVLQMGVDEIVVVDDASTDETVKYLETHAPTVKLVRHQKNKSFPITVNDGFANTDADIVFLLNQDLKPKARLVKNTLRHFSDPEVFAVTFNENNRSWADGYWKDGMLEFKNGVLDEKLHESLWPSGGSSAIRKQYWDVLGGFDPIFTPGYYEDLDLGLRAKKAGYKTIWDPKCVVDHLTEGTFPKSFSPKKLQYIKERNYLIAIWKNIDKKLWLAHFGSLIKRTVAHPGYLIPLLMALWRKLVF
jgi:GT2 family glycosyltransferase